MPNGCEFHLVGCLFIVLVAFNFLKFSSGTQLSYLGTVWSFGLLFKLCLATPEQPSEEGWLFLLRTLPSGSDCWEPVLFRAGGTPSVYACAPSGCPFPRLGVSSWAGMCRALELSLQLSSLVLSLAAPWPTELPAPFPQPREATSFLLGSSSSSMFWQPGNCPGSKLFNHRDPPLVSLSGNSVLSCLASSVWKPLFHVLVWVFFFQLFQVEALLSFLNLNFLT